MYNINKLWNNLYRFQRESIQAIAILIQIRLLLAAKMIFAPKSMSRKCY